MITLKSVLLYVNNTKCDSKKFQGLLIEYLSKRNIKYSVIYADKQDHSQINNYDLVITLGGDGTVLQALRRMKGEQIPVLGINLGTVGFITEISKDEWEDAFDSYFDGKLRVSNRTLLDIEVKRDNKVVFSTIGVNDGIITANNIKAIIELKVFFSNIEIGEIHGDGVIISTPTGSTAYSLAAGGPIINPEMNALIFTPICPYSLSNRPLVTGGDEVIKVSISRPQRSNILLTVDGQECFLLAEDDEVFFREHDKFGHIVMSDKRSFFDVVRTKFKWTGGPRA